MAGSGHRAKRTIASAGTLSLLLVAYHALYDESEDPDKDQADNYRSDIIFDEFQHGLYLQSDSDQTFTFVVSFVASLYGRNRSQIMQAMRATEMMMPAMFALPVKRLPIWVMINAMM